MSPLCPWVYVSLRKVLINTRAVKGFGSVWKEVTQPFKTRLTQDEGESSHSEKTTTCLHSNQKATERKANSMKANRPFQLSNQHSIEHSFICSFCDNKEEQGTKWWYMEPMLKICKHSTLLKVCFFNNKWCWINCLKVATVPIVEETPNNCQNMLILQYTLFPILSTQKII